MQRLLKRWTRKTRKDTARLDVVMGENEALSVKFLHGVASGDPTSHSVILWTKLTPSNVQNPILVQYEIFADDASDTSTPRTRIQYGTVSTNIDVDYTVKVDVKGLQPSTRYFYQFLSLSSPTQDAQNTTVIAKSVMGSTKTLPDKDADVAQIKIVVVSCCNLAWGFFNGYASAARHEDIVLVVHLGDYIYEYAHGEYGDGAPMGRIPLPNRHLQNLQDYRTRHAQYKMDPDVQELHLNTPMIALGKLADLIMLDTRIEGRDENAWSRKVVGDANRTIMGNDQEQWLHNELVTSQSRGAQWRLLGNQVVFSPLKAWGHMLNPDAWDGYPANRQRLLDVMKNGNIDNNVFITGDIHAAFGFDVTLHPTRPSHYNASTGKGSVAVELVTPSIASGSPLENIPLIGDRLEKPAVRLVKKMEPHVKYTDLLRHGYMLITLTPEVLQSDFWFSDTIKRSDASESLGASVFVERGANRITRVVQYPLKRVKLNERGRRREITASAHGTDDMRAAELCVNKIQIVSRVTADLNVSGSWVGSEADEGRPQIRWKTTNVLLIAATYLLQPLMTENTPSEAFNPNQPITPRNPIISHLKLPHTYEIAPYVPTTATQSIPKPSEPDLLYPSEQHLKQKRQNLPPSPFIFQSPDPNASPIPSTLPSPTPVNLLPDIVPDQPLNSPYASLLPSTPKSATQCVVTLLQGVTNQRDACGYPACLRGINVNALKQGSTQAIALGVCITRGTLNAQFDTYNIAPFYASLLESICPDMSTIYNFLVDGLVMSLSPRAFAYSDIVPAVTTSGECTTRNPVTQRRCAAEVSANSVNVLANYLVNVSAGAPSLLDMKATECTTCAQLLYGTPGMYPANATFLSGSQHVAGTDYQNLAVAAIETVCGPAFMNSSVPLRIGSPLNSSSSLDLIPQYLILVLALILMLMVHRA
ncbi:hypothetical protein SmJEL517_g05984 [Synchytrium microbalum]|uniref:PhoD-like phosphatase metallophosphatase domain-containing protein n=1 Tax=Synchytrium microbalum TaxID=1806994 RepID=A0A507BTR9_9FUNG|nr:uncharacterized protein SmJEL517_g05984 [Synchytrium microbalum]TPX30459.1 hypothetical protein SmJEL517_g05984 [Synchytrium microbalum]